MGSICYLWLLKRIGQFLNLYCNEFRMFALILNALCTDFNIEYFDGFDDMQGNFTGTVAMYLFFHQSGRE